MTSKTLARRRGEEEQEGRTGSMAQAMEIDAPKKVELFEAAETGNASSFKSLADDVLSRALSLRNDDGRSLLHVAASFARPEIVRLLASAGSAGGVVNSRDEDGWAPLHSAASCGNAEIVGILLENGADVNLTNDGGRTALHYAASKGWQKIAETLLSQGAKVNIKDKVGCTPLHRAASTGHFELCELLIEEGAEVDAVDRAGQTPLMQAVICQNKEFCRQPMNHDVSLKSNQNNKLAELVGQVALLLIRHGADVDMEDKEGYTVLGRASGDFRNVLVDAAKAMLEG